jgi:hypothetical protein
LHAQDRARVQASLDEDRVHGLLREVAALDVRVARAHRRRGEHSRASHDFHEIARAALSRTERAT